MVFTHEAPVPVSSELIRLDDWLFNLSESEYKAAASAHRAIGTNGGPKFAGMVNVESIGGSLLVQHYRTETLSANHTRLVSKETRAYLFHILPVRVKVVWEMEVLAVSPTGSRLRCTIDVRLPLWLRIMGLFIGNNHWVRKHLVEETVGFARDITRKALPEPR